MARSSSPSGPSAALDEERQRLLRRSGQLLGLGRRERPPGPPVRVERQCSGSLEEGSGGRQSAARLRPSGGALKLFGDVLVGRQRGPGQMPGAAIRVDLRIGGGRQRPVGSAPILGRRRPVDRRAQQRMAEGDARPELQQPRPHGRAQRVDVEPSSAADRHSSAGSPVGSAAASSSSCWVVGGQLLNPTAKARLDAALQRQLGRQTEAAGQARRATTHAAARARRAGCPGPRRGCGPYALIERRADDRGEQLARILVREPLQPQVRQPRQFIELGGSADGEQQHDRLRSEPPGHERQHQGRGLIKPLGVIDQAEQRQLLGGIGQQAEHRETDEESGRAGAPVLSPKAVARASR